MYLTGLQNSALAALLVVPFSTARHYDYLTGIGPGDICKVADLNRDSLAPSVKVMCYFEWMTKGGANQLNYVVKVAPLDSKHIETNDTCLQYSSSQQGRFTDGYVLEPCQAPWRKPFHDENNCLDESWDTTDCNDDSGWNIPKVLEDQLNDLVNKKCNLDHRKACGRYDDAFFMYDAHWNYEGNGMNWNAHLGYSNGGNCPRLWEPHTQFSDCVEDSIKEVTCGVPIEWVTPTRIEAWSDDDGDHNITFNCVKKGDMATFLGVDKGDL